MNKTFFSLLLLILSPATIALDKSIADLSKNTTPDKTQIYVMGMIHGQHLKSQLWGIEQVKKTIQEINPDVICIEMPPKRWPAVINEWRSEGTLSDSRIKVFPEYTKAVMPLSKTMNFTIEPCAGWTKKMALERRARIKLFSTSKETAEKYQAYQAAEAGVKKQLDANPIVDDDPFVIHSKIYDARTRFELTPYDTYLNDWIGAGGWTNINQAHYDLIEKTISKHSGKKILITFGAGHKYWFLEKLTSRKDIQLMDIRAFLPMKSLPEKNLP